ncbi:MAG: DUF4197 family protein, partial [Flavitalea sp.]
MIKKLFIPVLALLLFTGCDTLTGLQNGMGAGVLTESEAGEGIRQALSQGVTAAILNLNKQDGFFGNDAYKLFFPPDARKIERTLRDIGLGSQVDKAV